MPRLAYNSMRPQSALNWLSPVEYEHLLSIYAAKVAWQWVAGMIGLCLGKLPLGHFVLSPVHHAGRGSLSSKPWNKAVDFSKLTKCCDLFRFLKLFVSIFAGRAQYVLSRKNALKAKRIRKLLCVIYGKQWIIRTITKYNEIKDFYISENLVMLKHNRTYYFPLNFSLLFFWTKFFRTRENTGFSRSR